MTTTCHHSKYSCALSMSSVVSNDEVQIVPNLDGRLVDVNLNIGYCVHLDHPTLGEGNFGKVRLATHLKTFQKVAVKIIKKEKLKTSGARQSVDNELLALQRLKHPNIVRLLQHFETKECIEFVLEHCSNGNLSDYVEQRGRLQEVEARRFMLQLLNCLAFIHERGFYHRDIRPVNILLDAHLTIKLTGFQFNYDRFRLTDSINSTKGLLNSSAVTSSLNSEFVPPEVLLGMEGTTTTTSKYAGDVWCSGLVFYFLLSGRLPFKDISMARVFLKIKAGIYPSPANVSSKAIHFLGRLLTLDPALRVTVRDALRHVWLADNGTLNSFIITNKVDVDYIDRLDEETLDICMQLHRSEVEDRADLRFNILNRHSYQTATYWLIKNNFEEFKKLRLNYDDSTNIRPQFCQQQHSKLNRLARISNTRLCDENDGINRIITNRMASNSRPINNEVVDREKKSALLASSSLTTLVSVEEREDFQSNGGDDFVCWTHKRLLERKKNENDYRTRNGQFVSQSISRHCAGKANKVEDIAVLIVGNERKKKEKVEEESPRSMTSEQQQRGQQPRRTNVRLSKLFAEVEEKEDTAECETQFAWRNRSKKVEEREEGKKKEKKKVASIDRKRAANPFDTPEICKLNAGDKCSPISKSTDTTPVKTIKCILSKKLRSISFRQKSKGSPLRLDKNDKLVSKSTTFLSNMRKTNTNDEDLLSTKLANMRTDGEFGSISSICNSVEIQIGCGKTGSMVTTPLPCKNSSPSKSIVTTRRSTPTKFFPSFFTSPTRDGLKKVPRTNKSASTVAIITRFRDAFQCQQATRDLLFGWGVNCKLEDDGSKLRCCVSAMNELLVAFEVRFVTLPALNDNNFVAMKVKWVRGSFDDFRTIVKDMTTFFERKWSVYKAVGAKRTNAFVRDENASDGRETSTSCSTDSY